jgi:nitrite reductase/ring-hydroxylating ferredoxin subunit
VVARVGEITDGGRLLVEAGGHSIGVFRVGDEYFALLNRCPHNGAALCRGELVGTLESASPGQYSYDPDRKLLACPWHGWEFDLRTGQSYFDPARMRVRSYLVALESGQEVSAELQHGVAAVGLREGPYRAESFPVSVEGDYVVVTVAR